MLRVSYTQCSVPEMNMKIYIPLIAIFVLVLAVVSMQTTFALWDGSFPSAEFRISVTDENGTPISGAKLSVYERTGFLGLDRKLSYGFPLDQFKKNSQLVSSPDGIIKASHVGQDVEKGGFVFDLFWIIPIGFGERDFVVRVDAPDYRPQEIAFYEQLYSNCDSEPGILIDDPVPVCAYEAVLLREAR